MKYRDNEPKVDAGLAASLKALRTHPNAFAEGGYFSNTPPLASDTVDSLVAAIDIKPGVVNSAEIIQLDAHRPDPHLVVVGEKKAHVVPVALIESVIAGTANAEWSLGEELIRDILRDWLTQVQADKDDGR